MGGAISRDEYYSAKKEEEKRLFKLIAKIAGGVLTGFFVLGLFWGSFFSVDQGELGVVTRFGAVVRIAEPGAHLKVPYIEDVTPISVRTQTIDWNTDGKNDSRMETYSQDRQVAHLSVKVSWHIRPDPESIKTVYARFKNANNYADSVIIPRAPVAIKEVFGQFNAARVVEERKDFNVKVESQLRKEIESANAGSAMILDGIQVYDISFSPAYVKAVEDRMKAEVEVAQVAQNLERERKTAEITVVQAKASADAKLAEATAAAKAIKIKGEAEADAIRARAAALRDNPSLVELTKAERWNGALPTTIVPGTATPFMNVK